LLSYVTNVTSCQTPLRGSVAVAPNLPAR